MKKIVGGTMKFEGDIPYIVSIQWKSGSHFCSGNLLSLKKVLTACHCTSIFLEHEHTLFDINDVMVVGGSLSIKSNLVEQVRFVVESLNHGMCNEQGFSWTFDYGLYILDKPFSERYNGGVISTAPIFSTNATAAILKMEEMARSSQVCQTAGWGNQVVVKNGTIYSTLSEYIKVLEVTLLTRKDCLLILCKTPKCRCMDYDDLQQSGQWCAIGPVEQDACEGDSGGPLICSGFLFAILSWGPACGEMFYPSIYSGIYEVIDFWSSEIRTEPAPFTILVTCSLALWKMTSFTLIYKLLF